MAEKKKKKKEDLEIDEDERAYYAAEEQGIVPEEDELDKDTVKDEMEQGKRDESVYSEEGREKLEDDGELNPWEEGFMEGATGAGQLAKDALTGEPLMGVEDVVEIEMDGKTYRITSQENAKRFREKHEEEGDLD